MVSESASSQQHKKARLSSELVKSSDPESEHVSTSPTLHHKVYLQGQNNTKNLIMMKMRVFIQICLG